MSALDQPSVKLVAHAKINLYLHLTGQRGDGYHELDTLFAFTDFGDGLQINTAEGFTLQQTGLLAAELPDPGENLIWRAASLLADHAAVANGANITLEKVVPVAAGLGGGSADAAATLLGLCQLWGLNVPDEALHQLAIRLGADVPVCLDSTPAIAAGIGDVLKPIALSTCGVLLVNPNVALSTAAAFAKWHDMNAGFQPADTVDDAPEGFAPLIEYLREKRNDLEAPAITLVPEIATVLHDVAALPNCALARMSGSGATCFGLFETREMANEAARQLSMDRPEWWVQPTALKGA